MLKNSLIDEIQQKLNFQRIILLKLLNSKRLLSDHVEVLEECFYDLQKNSVSHNLSATKSLSLLSIGIGSLFAFKTSNFRFLMPTFSLLYSILYSTKIINEYKFSKNEKQTGELIKSIENFENSVKKNLIFLSESTIFHKFSNPSYFILNCIQCVTEVIKILHEATKMLENVKLNEKYEVLYIPIESLDDCECFQRTPDEFEAKTIKDFYNIFAYIQSQFLIRLGLHLASGNNFPAREIGKIVQQVDQETENALKYLKMVIVVQERPTIPRIVHQLPPELSNLQHLSLNFSVKLLSLANECSNMDIIISENIQKYDGEEDKKGFEDILPLMQTVESEIQTCQDEFKRLFITYKKFLNRNYQEELDAPVAKGVQKSTDESRIYSETDKTIFKDEFFAVDGFYSDPEDVKSEENFEYLENLNTKLTKKYFNPVLKQLKQKIEPIGLDFKKREKKVLKDKGIEIDSDDEKETNFSSCEEDFSDNDSDSSIEMKKKFERSSEKYEDVRRFLMAKDQANIFGLNPMGSVVNEDVLE